MKNLMKPFWAILLLVLSAPLALAEETTVDQALGAANTSWIMTATALVLFMTLPGLALFYGGLVHKKNVLSVLMHCFAMACILSVVWLFTCFGRQWAMDRRFICYLWQGTGWK